MYPYALTKWQGEELVKHFNKIYKLPTISLRFFNIYGPKSRTSGTYGAVFGVFLAQKIANKPLTIVGSGNQTRDFLHVSDLTNLILNLLTQKLEEKFIMLQAAKKLKGNKIAKLIGGKKALSQNVQVNLIDLWPIYVKLKKILIGLLKYR